MKRSNLFAFAPTADQDRILREMGVNCAKLWNEINYRAADRPEEPLGMA
jgi:hypothetical protein